MTHSRYNSHTDPVFKTLEILKLEDMFKLNMLKWYYRHIHQTLPFYFNDYEIRTHEDIHSYNTRNKKDVVNPPTRIQAARKCLRNYITIVLKCFPTEVLDKVNTHSAQGFRTYAKHYIIANYTIECIIENCYICNRPDL